MRFDAGGSVDAVFAFRFGGVGEGVGDQRGYAEFVQFGDNVRTRLLRRSGMVPLKVMPRMPILAPFTGRSAAISNRLTRRWAIKSTHAVIDATAGEDHLRMIPCGLARAVR